MALPWFTPIHCYLLGSGLSSLLSVAACALVVRQFWGRAGLWAALVAFAVGTMASELLGWLAWKLGFQTLTLITVNDQILQVLAIIFLVMVNLKIRKRWSGILLCCGFWLVFLPTHFLSHDFNFVRAVNGAWLFGGVLTTLFNLYFWEGLGDQPLHRRPEFWALAALFVLYASQSAKAFYVHLLPVHKNAVLGLYYPTSMLPDLLFAVYLILAVRADTHA